MSSNEQGGKWSFGKTLIQKTDPEKGNKRLFFQRPRNEYVNGFGSTSRDYFIGLDTIVNLIRLGNNVLTLQAVAHNGTRFDIEFKNVNIEKEILDIYPYFGTQYKNKTIRYSLSYDKPEHGFILVRPNYLKSMENKDEASSYYYFEDYHYPGFTTSDDGDDNVLDQRAIPGTSSTDLIPSAESKEVVDALRTEIRELNEQIQFLKGEILMYRKYDKHNQNMIQLQHDFLYILSWSNPTIEYFFA